MLALGVLPRTGSMAIVPKVRLYRFMRLANDSISKARDSHHGSFSLGRWCMRVVIEKASSSPVRSSALATQFWKMAARLKFGKPALTKGHETSGNCFAHDHLSPWYHRLCSKAS